MSLGLAREIGITHTGHELLLLVERWEHRTALHDAWGGVEGARVTLATASRRIQQSR
jgi:hypothetical protein